MMLQNAFHARHKGMHQNKHKHNYKKEGDENGKSKVDWCSSEFDGNNKFSTCITCKRKNHISKDC